MTTLPSTVRIVEVGPRDGLQNEPVTLDTRAKLEFIKALAASGLSQIEATSFVHPKVGPQLSDAAEVIAGLPKGFPVVFSALVPNEKGLDRALECGIRRIAIFAAASETFTQKNIGMTMEQSLDGYANVCRRATANGVSIRGYVSTAFVCPFEGNINRQRVRNVAGRLLDMGVDEVAVSDTIGAASPADVEQTVGFLLESIPARWIALHFHDTYGTALANVYAGLQLGISTFDASAGGLGGCPFAPGAAGNLATEDLVYMLERMGIATGVRLDAVVDAAQTVANALGRQLNSAAWRRRCGTCN